MGLIISVSEKQASKLFNRILTAGLLDSKRRVQRDKKKVYFPVRKKPLFLDDYSAKIEEQGSDHTEPDSISSYLNNRVSKKTLKKLRKSHEIVGQIIILELDRTLERNINNIAEYLLKTNPHVKTIVRKEGAHKGKMRLQKYVYLAGEKNFSTIHKENGIKIGLDIRKTYFSPRSSGERLRIANLVKPGEKILVMFSGSAPYPLVISKNSKAKEVMGVEVNKQAHKFAVSNIKLNKLTNVRVYCGDVRVVVPRLKGSFDRIIMPLPKQGESYLKLAFSKIKAGGWIHFYDFAKMDSIPSSTKKKILKSIGSSGKKVVIAKVVRCGQQAPRVFRVCADVKIV
ncbi:MAG: class I SAM-dependent methyltransferase family protein [Nanoarchaeota archaeon]